MRKLTNDELNRLSVDEYRKAEKMPVAIVLDNVRSANNVGSVFRTADCLGAEKICLCGITAIPPNKDINKTALGATESVDWKHFATTLDAVAELRAEGYTILSIEQAEGSIALQDFSPVVGRKYALIFGHEVNGVAQEVVDASDGCIEIPQVGTKHSFNISVSAGITLWEVFTKFRFENID
ncbi:MAG: RNA methyltransferase [Salinivirgaceae bacterium]|nr:RNA methyltransferase [Salinivirgaceae bacterium]